MKMKIRTRTAVFDAELDGSDISNAIWLSLPFKADTNMLGDEIYFELPLDCPMDGDRVTELEAGDIAYWPKVGALCIFFGPTPLSGEDGRPVSPFPVIRIGKVLGDLSEMGHAGDRSRISLER
jgi:uncharacterized protein